jgi:hypothetical protein
MKFTAIAIQFFNGKAFQDLNGSPLRFVNVYLIESDLSAFSTELASRWSAAAEKVSG